MFPLLAVGTLVLVFLATRGPGPTEITTTQNTVSAFPAPTVDGLQRAMAAIRNGGKGGLTTRTDSSGNQWAVASFPNIGNGLIAVAASFIQSASGTKLAPGAVLSLAYVQNMNTDERQELALFMSPGIDEEPNDVRKLWGLRAV